MSFKTHKLPQAGCILTHCATVDSEKERKKKKKEARGVKLVDEYKYNTALWYVVLLNWNIYSRLDLYKKKTMV